VEGKYAVANKDALTLDAEAVNLQALSPGARVIDCAAFGTYFSGGAAFRKG